MKKSNHIEKVTILAVISTFVALFSLILCLFLLDRSLNNNGVAFQNTNIDEVNTDSEEEIANIVGYEITNLSSIVTSGDALVIEEPSSSNNVISYGLEVKEVSDIGQFYFDIVNTGDVDIVVSNISLEGLGQYSSYIEVSWDGIEENCVIEAGESVDDVVVTTLYNISLNESIKLDNVKLVIDIEKSDDDMEVEE